jgi:hypothetical protein
MSILVLHDFSKALDTVNFKLLKSYLTDRSQCVFTNGTLSSFLSVTQGVSQGSTTMYMNCNLTWNDQIISVVSSGNGALSRLWYTAD